MLKLPHNVIQLIVYWSRSWFCPMGIHYYCKGDHPFKQHRPRSLQIHSVPNGNQRWRQSLCSKNTSTQECIPVGCVPSAAVAVGGGPSVGLETPQVWAWRHPSGVGLETPPRVWAWRPPMARPLNFPPGCGP